MTVRPAPDAIVEAAGNRLLNDPATFVCNARAQGFAPAEAMALYHEKRLILVHRRLAYPLDSEWGEAAAWDAQLRAAVLAIHTPAQWHAYADRWRTGDWATLKLPNRALDAWWSFDQDGSAGDVPRHFYARQPGSGMPSDWHVLPPFQGQPWTWDRMAEFLAFEASISQMDDSERPPPRRWTVDIGSACLVRLMRRIGLAGAPHAPDRPGWRGMALGHAAHRHLVVGRVLPLAPDPAPSGAPDRLARPVAGPGRRLVDSHLADPAGDGSRRLVQ